jgi:hypothetical protein
MMMITMLGMNLRHAPGERAAHRHPIEELHTLRTLLSTQSWIEFPFSRVGGRLVAARFFQIFTQYQSTR